MAGAGSAAQISTIRRSNVSLSWEIANAFQAYLQIFRSRRLAGPKWHLTSIFGLLLRLLITRSQFMNLYLLLVRINMIVFWLNLYQILSDRRLIGFHVRALGRVHNVIMYKNAARFKRGLILIRTI